MDQPAGKEVGPQAIDSGRAEVLVLRGSEPGGEGRPIGPLVVELGLVAFKELGLGLADKLARLGGRGNADGRSAKLRGSGGQALAKAVLSAARGRLLADDPVGGRLVAGALGRIAHLGKEGGQAPEIGL